MGSNQKRRTPWNIYTERRSERELQDFIQHSRSKNLRIPESLFSASDLPQPTEDNRLAALKRQRLTLPDVRPIFVFIYLFIILSPQPALNASVANDVPLSQNLDEDQHDPIPDGDGIDTAIWPGSTTDRDPEGVCVPGSDHRLDGPEESGLSIPN